MESSCTSLDSVSSLLTIVASLLTIIAFFPNITLKILLRDYLGNGEAAADKLREAVEKAKMTPAGMSEVLIKNRRNKARVVGELLEVLRARAERNERCGGGMREECELNGVEEEEEEKEEEMVIFA